MILHLDLSTGASGDKLLGALLELNEKLGLASFDDLTHKAYELLPSLEIKRESVARGGIAATHITVNEPSQAHHRHWKDIRALIESAAIRNIVSNSIAERAIRVFARVAKAEAKVHGVEQDRVHFHEVGAADSIVDILFNSYLLDQLQPTAVFATPLALGQGTLVCAHGELPVPAPATAEVLTATDCDVLPVYSSVHEGELTTPTGAALIAEFVTDFAPLPCSRPLAVGYGAGSRELVGATNVIRALSANPAPLAGGLEAGSTGSLGADEVTLLSLQGVAQLECNLDHLSAEAAAFACEELLAAGALDVWQEPITMKKGRLGSKLVALTKPEQAREYAQMIIELTGSLGVRSAYLERIVTSRTNITLETPYGLVPFKAAQIGSPSHRRQYLRPEHDAVASLARKHNLAYATLYAELLEHGKTYSAHL